MNNRLLKKSVIYFIGSLSSRIMSALLIPIYAFYISVDDFGTYDFSQTIMGIISPIIVISIWEAILRFMLSEDNLEKKRRIISTSIIFSIFMSLIFVVFSTIAISFFSSPPEFAHQIIIMIVLHTLVYVWQYAARGSSSNRLFVISGITSTIVNFLMVLLLVVYLKLGLFGLYLSYNLGQISTIIVLEFKLRLIGNMKLKYFDYNILKMMLIFSAPLVLNLISAWLISGFGRTIITFKIGSSANGMYSFANKFSMLITMIGSVITMAIIEEAILSIKNKKIDSRFAETIQELFELFLELLIIAMPAISIFYEIISNTNYNESIIFVPGLLLYAVFNTMASNVGSVFQAINKTGYQFTTTLLGGLTTVFVSWLFINILGIHAVVIAQILGALIMLITRYFIVNKFINFKISWKSIINLIVVFSIVVLISLNANLGINIILELLFIVFVAYLHKSFIVKIFDKLKKGRDS